MPAGKTVSPSLPFLLCPSVHSSLPPSLLFCSDLDTRGRQMNNRGWVCLTFNTSREEDKIAEAITSSWFT